MLQHQIVQSPARLGLTNPNSPSLQNSTPPRFPSSQQPPQQQQQQQPPQHLVHPNLSVPAPAASSSNLLSFLPPLPRAQALLLQMASLASKLFEVSPNRSLWLSAFRGSFPTFLSSQIQSHPPPPLESTPTSSKEVIALFTSLQTQLFEAVAQLQEILDLQDVKQKFAREIKSKDAALLSFANKLKEAERVLDMLADDYSDYRRPKRSKPDEDGVEGDDSSSTTTVASQLKLSDILSYAHRISYTTFAPPEFGAGQAPLRGALPPAPQEEQMRASQLYNFAALDVGLPKIDESTEKTIEPFMEPPPPVDADPLWQLKAALKVPPGWKPGMPVDLQDLPLPSSLPSSLPPLESLPVRPAPPPVLQRPPETIQVRHVELEIEDSEDDSSDYSGEESSSD